MSAVRYLTSVVLPKHSGGRLDGVPMTSNNIPDNDLVKTPLAERITEVYWLRVGDTGLGPEQATTMRAEFESRVAEAPS